ncbi:ATP-binding protein [Paenibacillus oceani]|uniref:histidine kinase n=1 Tax=Paenibacillus oceani TaxID=2772510 RepID=A0A927C7D8_9BACL|nr:sensor histidine kinase [Paenibacillus oceani]MBD2862224.1 sensor histidine kinase [Paenibacillus oceani]
MGIDVKDSGRGIPEEDRPYNFERFYRGSNKKYKTGLGLGLPFSLMLAKVQNGSLYLKHSSSESTVVTLTLPYK